MSVLAELDKAALPVDAPAATPRFADVLARVLRRPAIPDDGPKVPAP